MIRSNNQVTAGSMERFQISAVIASLYVVGTRIVLAVHSDMRPIAISEFFENSI